MGKLKNAKTKFGKYLYNLLAAHSQLLNAWRGGDRDETVSGDIGKARRDGYAGPLREGIGKRLDAIDPNHCENAIEDDEGKDEIIEKKHQ